MYGMVVPPAIESTIPAGGGTYDTTTTTTTTISGGGTTSTCGHNEKSLGSIFLFDFFSSKVLTVCRNVPIADQNY
jgi:hypothetical protein